MTAPVCLQLFAQVWLRRQGGGLQPLAEGLQIEAAATHQQSGPSPLLLLLNQRLGMAAELLQVDGLIRRAEVQQLVGGLLLLVGRRFGRADVHARIELTGINRENPAIELLGQGNSKAGLAAGRWPQNQHHQWGHCIPCLNSPGDSSRTAHGSRW